MSAASARDATSEGPEPTEPSAPTSDGRLHGPRGAGGEVSVRVIPRGPLLVRGADTVLDADGTPHPVTRPVVALCACDKSSRKPWCDGTHKVVRRV